MTKKGWPAGHRQHGQIAARDADWWAKSFAVIPTRINAAQGRAIPTKEGNTMADTTTDAPEAAEAPEPADELLDVSGTEYQAAAAQLAGEAVQGQDGTTEGDHDEAEPTGREARYRQRAHDAEAERDRLAGLVEDMRQEEIQRLAASRLADASDLFRDGASVADLLDDDGHVDAAKLDGLVDKLLTAHPHWRAELPRHRGPLYSGASNMRSVDVKPMGFADAFAPKAE
jgi:hypothetical protein